ncbi:MAG: sulfurtransferase complex subunit TusD [Pseudohaliea sp.]
MRYALLVLAPPQATAVHRAAIGLCEAALAAGHALPRVFFSDAGTQVALASAVPPGDEPSPLEGWQALARDHGVELVACIGSAVRHGVLDADEAARFERPAATLAEGFTLGGLGLLVEATAAADRALTFGGGAP